MKRGKCALCPHNEYLHNDRVSPTGRCMVEGCDHEFADLDSSRSQLALWGVKL